MVVHADRPDIAARQIPHTARLHSGGGYHAVADLFLLLQQDGDGRVVPQTPRLTMGPDGLTAHFAVVGVDVVKKVPARRAAGPHLVLQLRQRHRQLLVGALGDLPQGHLRLEQHVGAVDVVPQIEFVAALGIVAAAHPDGRHAAADAGLHENGAGQIGNGALQQDIQRPGIVPHGLVNDGPCAI